MNPAPVSSLAAPSREPPPRRRPVKNVIFDFGGVLVEWQPQRIVDRFYSDPALRQRVRDAVFQHPDWIEMDRGTLEEQDAAVRFADRMDRPVSEMIELLQQVKESLLPIAETIAILRDLERRGIPVYGLSNMAATTFAYLRERHDHWSLFKGIVISAEIKMIKPEARIFEHICATYALDPHETVFIDDNLPNIESAKRLGFSTILFSSPGQCAAELEGLLAQAA
ncbi:MAG TPA: HAD family phosphatase [Steroidobacteraceae bacterium]|nr:HAD family phosphatase [Steroidobacteraceae bacterium]